jgi:hypothetical protein
MALFGPKVGHDALFDEVCTYHTIDKKQKLLLQSVVKKYQMARPVEIFILPDMMRQALSDADFAADNADLQKLYDAWFIDARQRK